MRKVAIALFCLSLSTYAVKAQDNKQVNSTTKEEGGVLKFKDKDNTHNYGEVNEGDPAEYDFEFTNTGNMPVIIKEAHGSCGCTVPQWPKEPIPPKGKGKIHVSYNTNGRPGPISKEVTLTTNTNNTDKTEILHIRGTVKGKNGGATPPPPPPAPGAVPPPPVPVPAPGAVPPPPPMPEKH